MDAPPTEAPPERIVYGEIEEVEIRTLKPHPKNPRVADTAAIMESLTANGQFRPVLVQTSTNRIIAGHHMVKAAKQLKWKRIGIVRLDVDDEAALRILLADNRTADLGSYDTSILADILKEIPTATIGTGYDDADVRAVLAAMEERDETLLATAINKPSVDVTWEPMPDRDMTLEERIAEQSAVTSGRREAEKALLGMDVLQEHEDRGNEHRDLAGLQGRLEQIVNGRQLAGPNYWGIPDLRTDMLIEELPDPVDTWARWDVTPDDGKTTWVYNYGVTNATKLPWDRTILSFFTWDERFMVWWNDPAFYTAKVLLAGCTQAIVPDFSMWGDDPRILHIQAHYRAMWLGRFFQEAGMRVMPRIHFDDLESLNYCTLGIPQKAPVVAACFQAGNEWKDANKATEKPETFRTFIKWADPGHLLVYGGNPARELVEMANLPKGLPITFIENFASKRRGKVFDVKQGKTRVEAEANEDAPDAHDDEGE